MSNIYFFLHMSSLFPISFLFCLLFLFVYFTLKVLVRYIRNRHPVVASYHAFLFKGNFIIITNHKQRQGLCRKRVLVAAAPELLLLCLYGHPPLQAFQQHCQHALPKQTDRGSSEVHWLWCLMCKSSMSFNFLWVCMCVFLYEIIFVVVVVVLGVFCFCFFN